MPETAASNETRPAGIRKKKKEENKPRKRKLFAKSV